MVEENAEYQIQLGVRSGGIVIITLKRLKALNVLMRDMLTRLAELFQELDQRSVVKVIILTGAGRASNAGSGSLRALLFLISVKLLAFKIASKFVCTSSLSPKFSHKSCIMRLRFVRLVHYLRTLFGLAEFFKKSLHLDMK
jgi:hypothetical protein